jgi:sugar phosphate isomerase/epimerase
VFSSLNAKALGLALPAEEVIDLAAAAGFGGVDLLVRDLVESGSDVAGLRSRIVDRGLRPGAWPLPVDWRGDEGRFRYDLARLPRYAGAAEALGLSRTGTWVLPETPGPLPPGTTPDAYRNATIDWQIERLSAVARVLNDFGVRLGLEVIGVESFRSGKGIPLTCRLADLGGALDRLRSRSANVGVLVDVFHLYAAGEDVAEGLRPGAEDVVWVHVADPPAGAPPHLGTIRDDDRGLPGESGRVDVRGFLQGLDRLGYEGPVTAEPMPGCRSLAAKSPEAAVRQVADALRGVWPRHAL